LFLRWKRDRADQEEKVKLDKHFIVLIEELIMLIVRFGGKESIIFIFGNILKSSLTKLSAKKIFFCCC
jgi:hypothetical protein